MLQEAFTPVEQTFLRLFSQIETVQWYFYCIIVPLFIMTYLTYESKCSATFKIKCPASFSLILN